MNGRNLSPTDDVARQWYEQMWSEGDEDLARSLVHPDYDPSWVSIPATGADQVIHEMRYFRGAFPDLRYEVVEQAVNGRRVWVRYRATATHAGSAWGFEATGRPVSYEGATILVLHEDGRVLDRWGAFCFYDVLVELGLTPPLWELKERLDASA